MGTETTFAGLIANPQSEKVFLCEAKPGEAVTNFVQATVKYAGFTCDLSLSDLIFVSNPSTDISAMTGKYLTLVDGAGKKLILLIGAAGTGESYTDLLGAWNLTSGWTPYQATITDANTFTATGNPAAVYIPDFHVSGGLYKGSFAATVSAGTALMESQGSAQALIANGESDKYYTFVAANLGLAITNYTTSAGNTTDITVMLLSRVTAPSADGATCTIITEDAGFDRSAASYTAYVSLTSAYYESSLVFALSYLNETLTLADASTETIRKSVVACELDGTALTVQTSVADVDANAGSYWHDTANALLYIHAPDDGSPNHHTVIVYFWVYFATKGIVLDSRYYEPYIAENGIPSLSQESQQIHWGASQISSGSVVLQNGRGYFDQISKRWIWNNKDIKLLLGGDLLAYSEYTSVFVGKIMKAGFTKSEYTLDIESKAFALLRLLPINNFWTSTWANLDPSAEGKPIPYYWGSYSAAQAPVVTCINTAYAANTYQFKICDCAFHAIKSITQVYIDLGAGAGWETQAHANEDLANGTFTIVNASFVLGTSRVKVAFEGYHSGGTLIDGAPEFVEDLLLNQCGYLAADLNAASFTASKTSSSCVLNVAIEKETSALNIIEVACQSDLAFFDEDGAGLLRYRTWEPVATGTLPVLAKEDILEDPEIDEDTSQLYYRVRAGYSWIGETDERLYTEASNNPSRYKYGRSEHLTIDTYLREKADADILAERLNWITRNPSPVIDLTLKAGLIDKTLGDKIKLTLARAPFETAGGYDERIFEIIGKDISCFPLFVTLKARDLAGIGNDVGFWMGPTAPAWAAATAQEKDDSGFWCDANGYCLTADSASLNKSLWW